MALQELDKVLSIKFYVEATKRNGDDKELESLKIMDRVIERYLKKKNYIHWALCTRDSFKTQKKSMAELHRLHLQITSPKTTRSLSLNDRRKEGLPSLNQPTRIEFLCMK